MQTFLGGARGSLFTRMGFVVIHDKTVDEWGTAVHGYFMTEPPAVVDMELNLDLHRTSIPGAQMRGTRATRRAKCIAAANRGWMSDKIPPPAGQEKCFYLTSPFIEPAT